MTPCLIASVVLITAYAESAAAQAPLWTSLADTSATAKPATWASNPAWPAVDDSGRVTWARVIPRHEERRALTLRRLAAPDAPGDTLALARRWLMLDMPGVRGLPLYALRRAAPLFLAAGDSARADSIWAALAERSGLWRWESVRYRGLLALARGAPARADSILGELEHRDLGAGDRAAWLALRARTAAAVGDTARALDLCRQVVRVSPALPPASEAETLLDTLSAARGDTLSYADLDDLADVDALRGDRDGVALRLARAFAIAPSADRFHAGLKYGEALRLARRYAQASATLDSLGRHAHGEARAQVLLERARVERDARRPDEALHLYGQAMKASHDSLLIATALWERAREAEQEQKLHPARADYQRLAEIGRGKTSDASFRAGLLWYISGNAREAERWWGRSDSDPARFWRAIVLRPTRRREADSLLAVLASRPGYSFYTVVARESLGVRGWPGAAAVATAGLGDEPALALSTLLVEGGLGDDGAELAARWAAGDVRDTVFGPALPQARRAACLIAAAQVSFEAGRMPQGIRLAQRALQASADSGDASRWACVPWIYPPAYESLVRWRAFQAADPAIDPALLSALIWQESRFDAAARSRSNALGLMQLMMFTARRTLGAKAVAAESTLFDPALNTAAGTRYLQGLIGRFGGNVPAALAAYNSGPNRVLQHWLELSRRHGDALFCELVVFPETEDYVKKILGARSAYRELAPLLTADGETPH